MPTRLNVILLTILIALAAAPLVAEEPAQTDAASSDEDRPDAGESERREDRIELPTVYVTGPATGRQYGVTATKTGTPLKEAPQSISVITADQMQEQGAGSLSQALRYTPGVFGEPFGFEPRLTFLRMRGFDATTSGMYRDGLQQRNPDFVVAYQIEPYAAERIDVLKGPASVLYGQGSPGGLINLVSKRPTLAPFREAGVEVGSFERKQLNFDLGGPLDDDGTYSYRLTGLVRDSETQVDFIPNDRVFLQPALTWRPSLDTNITFLGYYQDDDALSSQAIPAVGTIVPNPNGEIPVNRFTGEPGVDEYDRKEYSLGYLLEHHVREDIILRQNVRSYASELEDITIFSTGLQADLRTIDRALFEGFGDLDGVALDNQVQIELDTESMSHTILVGLDYQDISASSTQNFGGAPSLDVIDPVYGQSVPDPFPFRDFRTEQEQLGLYVQDQIDIGEDWVLSLNGRYDNAETRTESFLAGTVTDQDDDAFTGRAGLIYLAENGLAPYLSYSESFLPALGTDGDGVPFDPETGQQVETGIKYEPPGERSYYTLSLFDLTRENIVQFDPATFLPFQTGEVVSRGVELEAITRFDSGLDLTGSVSVLDMEVTESSNPVEIGKRPTQVPRHQASVWADYSFGPEVVEGLGVGAGLRYVGTNFADSANTVKAPANLLLDLAVYYDWGDYSFQLNLHNATDEDHFGGCFLRGGDQFCTFGQERTVKASLRYRW